MLEELITTYINAKKKYEELSANTHGFSISYAQAQGDYGESMDNLVDFIEKHSETLIAWERQNALRLSPLED